MHDIIFILAILYAFAAISLAIYGFNALLFTALFVWLRRRETHAAAVEAVSPESFPSVTIQLPIFNERFVVERLIKAVAAIDYPRQRFRFRC